MARHKRLKTGFTTGTAATAAAQAALLCLLAHKAPASVSVLLLTGDRLEIPVAVCRRLSADAAEGRVIKDAGDDPDITHRAEIGARVRLLPAGGEKRVRISGGEGVGTVTKPGLEIPPGEAAINPGPRRMITQALTAVLEAAGFRGGVAVEIFVPQGVKLAAKTLNARLGIIGGLSILGTTGLVKPLSHDAYIATIDSCLAVARAMGLEEAVLTTGRRSERFAQALLPALPAEAFVQIGDFFQKSLKMAVARGFRRATLAVFFGKAIKMAQGVPHTHASRADLSLEALAGWVAETCGRPDLTAAVAAANTARHALEILKPACPAVMAAVGRRIIAAAHDFTSGAMEIRSMIFDYDGKAIFADPLTTPGRPQPADLREAKR
ncbi:MAG: cobalt-precorrin-5B (C(1))-methyltransferase CbiD [Desulfobacterales bacterium]